MTTLFLNSVVDHSLLCWLWTRITCHERYRNVAQDMNFWEHFYHELPNFNVTKIFKIFRGIGLNLRLLSHSFLDVPQMSRGEFCLRQSPPKTVSKIFTGCLETAFFVHHQQCALRLLWAVQMQLAVFQSYMNYKKWGFPRLQGSQIIESWCCDINWSLNEAVLKGSRWFL